MALLDRKSTRLNSSHSLHAALPIYFSFWPRRQFHLPAAGSHISVVRPGRLAILGLFNPDGALRSEEHTSELQSLPTRRSSDLFLLLAPASISFAGRREPHKRSSTGPSRHPGPL